MYTALELMRDPRRPLEKPRTRAPDHHRTDTAINQTACIVNLITVTGACLGGMDLVQPERKLCSENLEGSFWAKVFDGKIGKNF